MNKKIIILVLALASVAFAASEQVVLLIRNAVKVTGADVVLEDLVTDVSVMPQEWCSRRVFSSPEVGDVSYFSLTSVANALHDYRDMHQVVLRGEPVISVQREDRRLEKDELEAPVTDYLSRHSPWDGLDLQVEILNIPSNTRIPVGKTEFEVTEIDQKTARGYSMAHVLIRVDAISIKEISVDIEIHSLTDVWVVRKNIGPGHILDSADLRSEKRVVDATSGYVPSSENLEGYEVTRSLAASTLLSRNAISKPVCVKRGDWVSINASGGSFLVTLRAKALVNGRLGDRILCVNERSQRQVLIELDGVGHGVLVRM